MPRRKDTDPVYKVPGVRANEEVHDYVRLQRLDSLERDMTNMLPSARLNRHGKLIPDLREFRTRLRAKPRSAISITLAVETQQILAWLERELDMKRGQCIDWLAAGFRARYKQDKAREKEERRIKAGMAGEDPDDEDDLDDELDDDDDEDEDGNDADDE